MKELQAHTKPEIWENLGLLPLFLSFISHSIHSTITYLYNSAYILRMMCVLPV